MRRKVHLPSVGLGIVFATVFLVVCVTDRDRSNSSSSRDTQNIANDVDLLDDVGLPNDADLLVELFDDLFDDGDLLDLRVGNDADAQDTVEGSCDCESELAALEARVEQLEMLESQLADGSPSTTPVTWGDLSGLPPELDCPEDMEPIDGICVEISERIASATGCSQFIEATTACAEAGRHLCSSTEWLNACYTDAGLDDMVGNFEILADLTSAGSFIINGASACANFGEISCPPSGNIDQQLYYRCCL